MMRGLVDRIRQLPLRSPSFQEAEVTAVLQRHGAEPWFLYAFQQWRSRWHVWRGLLWAIQHLSREGQVLETGCGCGWNLFWLAANGFTSLSGIDLDAAAIAAGNELASDARYPLRLRVGDALEPGSFAESPFRLILALNWTYHVQQFDLGRFLERYREELIPGGVLLIDSIDSSFSANPDSRYLSSDWGKPPAQRRPTEYIHRLSVDEVRQVAGSRGYRVAESFSRGGVIPRGIHVLERS